MSARMDNTAVPSPCINVCQMDAASGLCLGCFRSLDEIACWSTASNASKLAVLGALPQREAQYLDP